MHSIKSKQAFQRTSHRVVWDLIRRAHQIAQHVERGFVKMTFNWWIFCLLAWCGFICKSSPPSRRRTSLGPSVGETSLPYHPNLIEGDIALPPRPHLNQTGSALNAFLKNKFSLWPKGKIPYKIDEGDFGFGIEPVFLDSQIMNITLALKKIQAGVPCIEFM